MLVEMRDSSLERMIDLEAKLAAALGRPVDLIRLGDIKADPLLLADTVAEGRVLVDREERWPGLRDREETLRQSGRQRDSRRTRDALAAIDRLLAA